MRGIDATQSGIFSYVSPEQRIPRNHPLRVVRALCDIGLKALSRDFDRMYSDIGRPSIPPERLLRALLLQILYTIRSELMLMEQLDYNLLVRWFVGLSMDDVVWDATVFSKNRDRMLESDIASLFFQAVVEEARALDLLSDEHFSVDGTLIEAWASQKSFQKKDNNGKPDDGGNGSANFHGDASKHGHPVEVAGDPRSHCQACQSCRRAHHAGRTDTRGCKATQCFSPGNEGSGAEPAPYVACGR